MRKLPKGKSDFRELIINDYVYIDTLLRAEARQTTSKY